MKQKNNNNKVNLYSAITMQIYSTVHLEKSSMLGQCQIIYQVIWNNWHLCVRKSLHKLVGFQLGLKWNNWLGFPNRKRKAIPNLRCCTRKSTISQGHFCLRSWHYKESFIIWTTEIMWMCIWFEWNSFWNITSFIPLYTIRRILSAILCFTGSQWSVFKHVPHCLSLFMCR